jgi:hypothetical protein
VARGQPRGDHKPDPSTSLRSNRRPAPEAGRAHRGKARAVPVWSQSE